VDGINGLQGPPGDSSWQDYGSVVAYDGGFLSSTVRVGPPASAASGSDVSIFLHEDGAASEGMSMHYDGGLDLLEFRGHEGGVAAKAHLVIEKDTGRVGIGTSAPTAHLEVQNSNDARVLFEGGSNRQSTVDLHEGGGFGGGRLRYNGDGNRFFIGTVNASGTEVDAIRLDRGQASTTLLGDVFIEGSLETGLGIGTATPLVDLHFQNHDLSIQAAALENDDLLIEAQDAVIGLYSSGVGAAGSAVVLKEVDGGLLQDTWGMVRETSAAGSDLRWTYRHAADGLADNYFNNETLMTLTTDGSLRVGVLEITGGSDLVEAFSTGEELHEPGTVLVIDTQNPGALTTTDRAYDPLVAGIVSGAGGVQPGIRMSQEGVLEGDALVALTGRVYVRCSTENGPIGVGDMLATASDPGLAMRAADPSRAFGAVLGKALGSLEEGSGLVLVLLGTH